jgi:hypothetical protein
MGTSLVGSSEGLILLGNQKPLGASLAPTTLGSIQLNRLLSLVEADLPFNHTSETDLRIRSDERLRALLVDRTVSFNKPTAANFTKVYVLSSNDRLDFINGKLNRRHKTLKQQ